jgi:hypothetical protein
MVFTEGNYMVLLRHSLVQLKLIVPIAPDQVFATDVMARNRFAAQYVMETWNVFLVMVLVNIHAQIAKAMEYVQIAMMVGSNARIAMERELFAVQNVTGMELFIVRIVTEVETI